MLKDKLNTPVVFVIFNTTDTTRRVLDAIAKAQPKKLFVIADGPRIDRPDDIEKCAATRKIIDSVDWDCEVMKYYSDKNIGMRRFVPSGIDWVFSKVEEAIILEHDCLPSPSFFYFCQELLEKYRHDERIMHISGNNFQGGRSRTKYSYYFTKYMNSWGWATWRRAWQLYDVDVKAWSEYRDKNRISEMCEDPLEQNYWAPIFNWIYECDVDPWDWAWLFACWYNKGLSVEPNVNLISNIGIGHPDSTHMPGDCLMPEAKRGDIWEIKHPPVVERNKEAEIFNFDYHLGGKKVREKGTLKGEILEFLDKI